MAKCFLNMKNLNRSLFLRLGGFSTTIINRVLICSAYYSHRIVAAYSMSDVFMVGYNRSISDVCYITKCSTIHFGWDYGDIKK
jgi:hypothetical protein